MGLILFFILDRIPLPDTHNPISLKKQQQQVIIKPQSGPILKGYLVLWLKRKPLSALRT